MGTPLPSLMVMVMLVPAAMLTVQTYEPEAPVWSGRFSMGAAETSPPGRMLRRTVPVAPCHERAAGWHWVIEAGVLMVAAEAAAANTTAPAAAEEILTILKDEKGVVRGARARCSPQGREAREGQAAQGPRQEASLVHPTIRERRHHPRWQAPHEPQRREVNSRVRTLHPHHAHTHARFGSRLMPLHYC